ncbi:hypothetical protein Cfor_09924 [Coptotermes formosanus]|uniref:Nose resistant-to-fluoxetine protein N-terminal domain-containing protein n=1 Tax=Coptotermes formosanus TaxID=36987 RepID=A0A6L2PC25_COPFO|nr:hypothetical protein Cfor_09924 [Coptotermes formosanus]
MRCLAMVCLLSAIGTVSAASNVTTAELQGEVDAMAHNVSVREMKSADWDGHSTETPLVNESLDALLEVFNPQKLARRWSNQQVNLTDECRAHVNEYLTHLNKGVLWALKMSDASGRYTPSFFWGNNYWTGSESLCYQLNSNAPPFPLGFYTVRLQIALPQNISPSERRILLGLCLPFSCNKEDVRQLLQLSVQDEEPQPRSIQILKVRSPHDSYIMWHDRTFWILFAVSVIVLGLMVLGTAYDLYLVHQSRHFFSKNYTYEITRASTPHLGVGPIKLEVGNFIQTTTSHANEGVINHGLQGSLGTLNGSINTTSNDSEASEDEDNTEYRNVVEKEFLFQTINNGAFSVDTFFFISGLLVSFLYFRTVTKIDMTKVTRSTGFRNGFIQYLGLMSYRYGRLTVPYLFVLGVVEVTMKWFYYNSVFEPPTADHISCPNYWWRNALYINTLFPVQDMCMLWSWYLADDTQFYVLGCMLLILAVSYFRVTAVLTVIFLTSSWFTTAFIAYNNRHNPSVDDPLALFDKIYDKPWTRLGPYLVGMTVGWILYKMDCKIKMSKAAVVIGWTLCIGCLAALVYGLYNTELDRLPAAIYSSLSHTAWALALSWIVIACSTGYGGYVNKILSASFLYPFSRVTYCAYLVHPIVIRIMVMRLDSPMHLGLEVIVRIHLYLIRNRT